MMTNAINFDKARIMPAKVTIGDPTNANYSSTLISAPIFASLLLGQDGISFRPPLQVLFYRLDIECSTGVRAFLRAFPARMY